MAIIEFREPPADISELGWTFFFIGGGVALLMAIANYIATRKMNKNTRAFYTARIFIAVSAFTLGVFSIVEVIQLGRKDILSVGQVATSCGGMLLWLLVAGVEVEERIEVAYKCLKRKPRKTSTRSSGSISTDTRSSTPPTATDDPAVP